MIITKKIYKSFKFSLYLSLLIVFSCNESDSIILNPPNSNNFKVKTFIIDADSSFHYRESQFNAGNSERIYLGKVDDNTESMLLFKINKELISNNNLCQEDDVDFNNLELRIFMKNGIPGLGSSVDNIMPSNIPNFTINDSGNLYTDCVAMEPGDVCAGECINNWVYTEDLNQTDCEIQDPNGWIGETVHCGNLGQTNQCCKYMDCISCCPSNNQNNYPCLLIFLFLEGLKHLLCSFNYFPSFFNIDFFTTSPLIERINALIIFLSYEILSSLIMGLETFCVVSKESTIQVNLA